MSLERDAVLQTWLSDYVDMYNTQPNLKTIQEWEERINMLYEDMWDEEE